MAEKISPPQEEYFELDEDPSLLSEAERNPHFSLLLEGYKGARQLAESDPANATYRTVLAAAQETILGTIAEKGYARTSHAQWSGKQ